MEHVCTQEKEILDLEHVTKDLETTITTVLKWQSAEEVHRATMYKMLYDLQAAQTQCRTSMTDAVKDLKVCLHKDFVTQNDLREFKGNLKWVVGTTFAGGAFVLAIIQYITSLIQGAQGAGL